MKCKEELRLLGIIAKCLLTFVKFVVSN